MNLLLSAGRAAAVFPSGPRPRRTPGVFAFLTAAIVALLGCSVACAQSADTGAISGRVLSTTTGKYMANAEIRVPGTNLFTITDDTGNYRLDRVPAGTTNVVVTYSGYRAATQAVTVTAGATATQDFTLVSTEQRDDEPVKLTAFTVSSEREGNAKAIMAQRNSMNITNSVSADVFGNTSEGNVGEFLKYMPGVDLEYVEADTRTPRLGGLDPSYTGVTINGMGMASADAFQQVNGTDNVRPGGGNRSFGFEQVSINSIESIEVSLTSAADQDASSPAGTINLKTKKAFDRKERFIGFSLVGMANSEDITLEKTYGPGDRRDYKIKPGATFDYYDSFLDHRLGVVLNLSESNMYNQQRLTQFGYNTTATAADPRPYVINSLTFKSGPKFTERFSSSLGLDYKVSNKLTVSFVGGYQWYSAQYFNRQIQVTNNSRAGITGDGLTNFNFVNDSATVAYGGAQASKLTRSFQLSPTFEYRNGPLEVNGGFNFSTSTNSYGAVARRQNTRDVPVNSVAGTDFHVSRSSTTDVDFTVQQIPGTTAASTSAAKDFSNFANFTNPRVVDDGRYNKKNIYQGQVDGKYTFAGNVPLTLKAGGKITWTSNANDDFTPLYTWNYTGPGGGSTGSWANYLSPTRFDMGSPAVNFVNLAGQTFSPNFADRRAIANLFYDHPEYFVNGASVLNYYQANYANKRRVREQIDAAYLMGTTRVNKLSLQAGLRLEETTVTSLVPDPLTLAQVRAAGYAVSQQTSIGAVGSPGQPGYQPAVVVTLPTTAAGIDYQYHSKPFIADSGSYHNLFPSASAKYAFLPNLHAQVGYSHTIRRPNYNDIGGSVSADDTNLILNVPAQELAPEISDNITARVVYYFEPAGTFSVTGTENSLKHANITIETPASQTEYADEFPGYSVRTKGNATGIRRTKTLTFDFRRTFNLLPRVFNRSTVFANYTRAVVDEGLKYGTPPMMASGGISSGIRKFTFGVNAKWTDDTPWNFVNGRFRKHRIMTDVNFGYRLTKNLSLFASGRNITNEADYVYENYDYNLIQKVEHYGSIWTFGVSGRF